MNESTTPDEDEPEEPAGTPPPPARIRLLPARESPYVIVIRRKPNRHVHVVRWNTQTGEVDHGSWFEGRLFPFRSDVSFDGQWMVYLALGSTGQTWNGVCRVPFLKTEMEGTNHGTWFGGGYWRDRATLVLNGWKPETGEVPFKVETLEGWSPEDLQLFYSKLTRDGWTRVGPNFGTHRKDGSVKGYTTIQEGDEGWRSQPSVHHPELRTRFVGYSKGYQFRFALSGSGLLDETVDSACWDSLGQLIFSRRGVVSCYTLSDLGTGVPTRTLDLEDLTPPRT